MKRNISIGEVYQKNFGKYPSTNLDQIRTIYGKQAYSRESNVRKLCNNIYIPDIIKNNYPSTLLEEQYESNKRKIKQEGSSFSYGSANCNVIKIPTIELPLIVNSTASGRDKSKISSNVMTTTKKAHPQNIRPCTKLNHEHPDISLTKEEYSIYGNRVPPNYRKLKLLGKGGFAIVWLCENLSNNNLSAIKQFSKKNGNISFDSGINELEISNSIKIKSEGIVHISLLLDYIQDYNDLWLIYELGGSSLSKDLFEIKGEFFKNERIYRIYHNEFYEILNRNPQLLKELLKQTLMGLKLLGDNNIIHSDLKSENILLKYENETIQIKIIDFGSAFIYNSNSRIMMTTPEYAAPELHKYTSNPNADLNEFFSSITPWSIDIWSLGTIFLEIITGFPLWLGMKCRAIINSKSIFSTGIFAVSGKCSSKILQRQKEVVSNLSSILKKYPCISISKEGFHLLSRMLDLNPKTRISPKDALAHSFLQ